MQKFVPALFAAGVLASSAAHAAELRPMEASSVMLGDMSGVAYYTAENDGYRVVTTLASGESATPVRFITTLLPGQKAILSVPREPGLSPISVEISRSGDRVTVTRGRNLADAAAK